MSLYVVVVDDDAVGTDEMETNSGTSCYHSETKPYVYKMGVPPKQNLLKEITGVVKETFFADDPWRPFKDKSGSKKFVLGLQTLFPILEWGRDYSVAKFKGDLIAGLTIASLCIPQVKNFLQRK